MNDLQIVLDQHLNAVQGRVDILPFLLTKVDEGCIEHRVDTWVMRDLTGVLSWLIERHSEDALEEGDLGRLHRLFVGDWRHTTHEPCEIFLVYIVGIEVLGI